MTRKLKVAAAGVLLASAAAFIWWRFASDMARAHVGLEQGSLRIETAGGPVEYAEVGQGVHEILSAVVTLLHQRRAP